MNGNGRRYSEQRARRSGFYLALAVCLVAVGIAAWSTYDAVKGYMEPAEQTATQSQLTSMQNEDVKNGQKAKSDDPEAPRASASSVAASQPQDSKQTTGEVNGAAGAAASATESAAASSAAAAGTEKTKGETAEETGAQVENPGVLYAVSTELTYPVSTQEVLSPYSAGKPVYSETMKDWRIHAGADLKAESGEAVLACGNGIVKSTYTDRLLGNVVEVEHGDYVLYYCGVGENFSVQEGDTVTMGQQIATVAAVPYESAEAAHLHLEAKRDGAYLDPLAVLEGDL